MKRKTRIMLCAFILMGLIFVPKNFIKAETTVVNVTDIKELCSPHDYENNTDKTWMYSVKGAAELLVKFSEDTKLEVGGADYIYIYDKNDEEIGKYGGTKLSGKTITVPYDTIKIRLVSDTSTTAYGFAVDSVVSMDSISVKTKPERTNYLVEQQPDYTGLVVQGNYSDGTSKEVTDGYTFSEVDNKTEGTQKVTVNYHGLTADFNIEYKNPKITKIEVTTKPKRTKYNYLEELDTTDMVLTATDQDDNTYLVKDKFEVTGYSSATVGKQTLTVNYADVSTTFEVEVVYPFTYTTSGNNVTITGISDANLTQLVIPEEIGGKTVTAIKASAFKDNVKLTSANLPETITSIGEYAFSGCTKLASVNIPSKITKLSDYVFQNCALVKVTLPDGLTMIGNYAFCECSKLASVVLPDKVESIGRNAFSDCKSIAEVKFPKILKTLGSYAYAGTGLTEVEVPSNVADMGRGCFVDTRLVNIKLPYVGNKKDAVEENAVLGYLFGYTTSYTTGTTEQYYKSGGKHYYYYIPSTLKSVEITDATRIPYRAFYNCNNLTNIKLNEGITSIGDYAFYNCTGLIDMELPETITGIGEYAFSGCTKLASVNIPSKITKLSDYVFQNCALVKVTLPEGLKEIGDYAFCGCSKLASVILPNKVESIGGSAFDGCKSITEVKFPTTLKTLGSYAYAGTGLTEVKVPSNVADMGRGCFVDTRLVNIKLPYVGNKKDAVEENAVLGYLFGYTTSYTTGTTEQYYKSGGKHYYYYIPSTLKSVEITDATRIPYRAFYNCNNLTNIKLNEGITSIGDYAFYNCTGLTDMELPKSVTSIGGGYAFLGCKNLILHDSKGTVVGDYAQKNNITLYSTKEFSLDKESMLLHKGDTAELNATVVMLNDQPDPEPNITWKSSNEDVVTVQDGTITVTGPGKAKITATIDDKQAECDVEVAYLLEDIIVEPEEISLYEGKEEKINVSYEPENTTDDKTITWTSSNEEVATVDENGIVHAINKGSAIITVQSSKENIKKTVKVTILRAVTDITFDQKVYVIGKDETLELNPTIMPEGYTDQLTWSSKDESVATVDATGKVTAINVGTTVINVTADSGVAVDGSVKVVVKADSISFSEEEIQISQGRTKKLNLQVTPIEATEDIVWTSSDENIATVSDEGIVTAVAVGDAEITATSDLGKTAKIKIHVVGYVPIEKLSFDDTEITLQKGEEKEVSLKKTPENSNDDIDYTMEDSEIAEYKDGKIIAKKAGNTTLHVISGSGVEVTLKIKVQVTATAIAFEKESYTVDSTGKLIIKMTPEDATDTITWASSDETIAKVEADGTVKGEIPGTCTITATTPSGLSATCEVRVKGNSITSLAQLQKIANTKGAYSCTLESDITLDSSVWIQYGTTLYLDLNGHTITEIDDANIVVDGDLMILDSSKEKAGKICYSYIKGNTVCCPVYVLTGSLILDSGTIVVNLEARFDNTKALGTTISTGIYNYMGKVLMKGGNIQIATKADFLDGVAYVVTGIYNGHAGGMLLTGGEISVTDSSSGGIDDNYVGSVSAIFDETKTDLVVSDMNLSVARTQGKKIYGLAGADIIYKMNGGSVISDKTNYKLDYDNTAAGGSAAAIFAKENVHMKSGNISITYKGNLTACGIYTKGKIVCGDFEDASVHADSPVIAPADGNKQFLTFMTDDDVYIYDGTYTGNFQYKKGVYYQKGYHLTNVETKGNNILTFNKAMLVPDEVKKEYKSSFSWSEDYSKCTVTLTNVEDETDTATYDCTITSEVKDPATCSKTGVTAYTALYEGYAETKEVEISIDPTVHVNTQIKDAVAATKNSKGYTGDIYCTDCGNLISKGTEIPATGSDSNEEPLPTPKPAPNMNPIQKPSQTGDISSSNTVSEVKPVGTEIKGSGTNGTFKVTNASATPEVVYVAPDNKAAAGIAIPETITSDGVTYKVTSIAPNAFKGCKKLKKVTIPAGITSIGAKAFYGCKNLKNITVKSTSLNKIGKKAFAKIHAKAKVKVPKAKKAAYKKLFKKAGLSGKGQKIK